MIHNQVSGSTFDESIIKRLKAFSFELDMILALRNLRIFSFKESHRYLLDLNTNTMVLIRKGSNCSIKSIGEIKSYVSVGNCIFLVDNKDIIEITI